MRHAIAISGASFALRPVGREDASLIVRLRSDPKRTRFLHPIVASIEAQERFLDSYFNRPGDYYFAIVDLAHHADEGLIGIYDMQPGGLAEFGRWILRPGSLAAVESVLLLYRVAFDVLGLREIYCRTVAENRLAASFHDSCGLPRRADFQGTVELHGTTHQLIEHYLTSERWPAVRERLTPLAQSVA